MTIPTVADVLASTHLCGHYHAWSTDSGSITIARDVLRPALEAAFDPSMPDWSALVEIDE